MTIEIQIWDNITLRVIIKLFFYMPLLTPINLYPFVNIYVWVKQLIVNPKYAPDFNIIMVLLEYTIPILFQFNK